VTGQCASTGIFAAVVESAPDPYAPLLSLPAEFIVYPSGDRDVTLTRLGGRVLSPDGSSVSQAKAVRLTYQTDSKLFEKQLLEMLERDHKNEMAKKVQNKKTLLISHRDGPKTCTLNPNPKPPHLSPRWAFRAKGSGVGVESLEFRVSSRIVPFALRGWALGF